jgi:hypothetical protein
MRSGPREGFRWTRETIAYAIDLWHREHLRTPTVDEWEAAAPNHPCRQTVLRAFGSWNAAMQAAGFRPRGRGVTREPWSRRRCPQSGRWLPSD